MIGLTAALGVAACGQTSSGNPANAAEQFYASKTVTIVVGSGAGGGFDTTAALSLATSAGTSPATQRWPVLFEKTACAVTFFATPSRPAEKGSFLTITVAYETAFAMI